MTPERTAEVSRILGHHFSFSETDRTTRFELTCSCGQSRTGNRGQINKFATDHTMRVADDALYAAGWNHVTLDDYLAERAGHAEKI